MEYIITFHTHFDALQYERFLKKAGLKGKLQPVPRALSSSCGTCVRFATEEPVGENTEFLAHDFEKIFKAEEKTYTLIADSDEI